MSVSLCIPSAISRHCEVNYLALLFLCVMTMPGLLASITWSVCTSECHRIWKSLFSWTAFGLIFVPFLVSIKSTPLIDFPTNLLLYPVVSMLIFLLCLPTALIQDIIDAFISIAAYSVLALLPRLVDLCVDQLSSDCLPLNLHCQCFCLPFQRIDWMCGKVAFSFQ